MVFESHLTERRSQRIYKTTSKTHIVTFAIVQILIRGHVFIVFRRKLRMFPIGGGGGGALVFFASQTFPIAQSSSCEAMLTFLNMVQLLENQ